MKDTEIKMSNVKKKKSYRKVPLRKKKKEERKAHVPNLSSFILETKQSEVKERIYTVACPGGLLSAQKTRLISHFFAF